MLRCGSTSVRAAAAKEMAPLLKGKDLQQWAEALVTPHPKAEKKKAAPAEGATASRPGGGGKGKPGAAAAAVPRPGGGKGMPGAAAKGGKANESAKRQPQAAGTQAAAAKKPRKA